MRRSIGNAAFFDREPLHLGNDFALAGGEIVDHEDFMALRQPVLDQV